MPHLFFQPRELALSNIVGALSGAEAYFYDAGTSTPRVTYPTNADALAGTNAHAHPVQANSIGVFPAIFLAGATPYKVDIKTVGGISLSRYPIDNIPVLPSAVELGLALNPATVREIAAGLETADLDTNFTEGTLERYGLIGDGATDDSAAFANAVLVAAQGVQLVGTTGKTYAINSAITPGTYFDLDLRGATIKPVGNTLGIANAALSATVIATISGAVTQGTRTLVVASATGLTEGMLCQILYNDAPTNDDLSFPPSWNRITNISGTTITFDRAWDVTYPSGAATSELHGYAQLRDKFRLVNGSFDGSASTYSGSTTGFAMRLEGYEKVQIDCSVENWTTNNANATLIQIFKCLDTRARVSSVDNSTPSTTLDIQSCLSASISQCYIDGDGFGINVTRCDGVDASSNYLRGRFKQNSDDAVTPRRSVRGLKFYGCRYIRSTGNKISEYESGFKVESCHSGTVSLNTISQCGLDTSYTGSAALNIGNQVDGFVTEHMIVSGNMVKDCGGVGIAVSSSVAVGKATISNNIVSNVQGHGIYCNVANSNINNNRIENWGMRNSGDFAIHYSSGATVTANRFRHDTLTGLACLRTFLDAGFAYAFRENVAETANPILESSKVFESAGASTILAANTSITVTHNLVLTPLVTEIFLTLGGNPTSDIGYLYIANITSTTFDIACRAAPGGSGISVSWNARLTFPRII